MMMKIRFSLAALALLAACGRQPDAARADAVAVVVGKAPAVAPARALAAAAGIRPAPTPSPSSSPLLTVAESARINTSEMWSEPIRAE